jgi:DNA-binding MarR family transcriptional regulator
MPPCPLTLDAYTYRIVRMELQSLPCYCATLRQAARAATTLYESVLAESGLHLTQYTILQALKLAPNLTTTDLADVIGIDQTTATRTLALVRKAGLIASRPGADRRERRWSLTALGESTFRKLHAKWESAQAAFEQRLGRSEAQTLRRAAFQAASRLAAG